MTATPIRRSSDLSPTELTVVRHLLVAILYLSILNTPALAGSSRVGNAVRDLRALDVGLREYHREYLRYPSEEEGLAVLLQQDRSPSNPLGLIFYEGSLQDPWDHPYQYHLASPGIPGTDYKLFSLGRDGISRSFGEDADDIRPETPFPTDRFAWFLAALGLAFNAIVVASLIFLVRCAFVHRRTLHA